MRRQRPHARIVIELPVHELAAAPAVMCMPLGVIAWSDGRNVCATPARLSPPLSGRSLLGSSSLRVMRRNRLRLYDAHEAPADRGAGTATSASAAPRMRSGG
jgi:hypothetical protein